MSSYLRLSGSGLSSGGGGGGGGTTIPAGSVSAPGLPVVGSASTGLYSANANELDVAANGVLVASFLSTGPAFTGALTSTTSLGFPGKSQIQSSADGFIGLYNSSGAGFTGLRFGGLTASYPMWKASGAGFAARVADDTADAALSASTLTVSGAVTAPVGTAGAPSLTFAGSTSTGMFSPAANTAALTAAGQEALRVAKDTGAVPMIGVGTTPVSAQTLTIKGQGASGATSTIVCRNSTNGLMLNVADNGVITVNTALACNSNGTVAAPAIRFGSALWSGMLSDGSNLTIVSAQTAAQSFDATQNATFVGTVKVQSSATLRSGSAATPNSVVTGNVGDIYLSTAGGAATTLWVKESGAATNTGWVGK